MSHPLVAITAFPINLEYPILEYVNFSLKYIFELICEIWELQFPTSFDEFGRLRLCGPKLLKYSSRSIANFVGRRANLNYFYFLFDLLKMRPLLPGQIFPL